MDNTNTIDFKRINNIVNFMRSITSLIDPEEVLEKSGINNIDNFSESQLTYFLVQAGIKNSQIKELFYGLNALETKDIQIINSNLEILEFFTVIVGGLYYAKGIRRLIKKEDIIIVKEILTPNGYDFIFQFATNKECIEDYQLVKDFEKYLKAIGHFILKAYLYNMKQIVSDFVFSKFELPTPELDIKHLRISNEYALRLAIKARNFIIEQSE